MTKLTRLLTCLLASGILLTLLWPHRAAAHPLAACSAAVTVTNTNDSGPGSLRQALADVCSGGVVDFAAGLANQTITLTSAELSIAKTVTITNPNAANLKVSGNNERRVFNIQAGAVVTMSSLSIINGSVIGSNGGGISNFGSLTLNDSRVNGNKSEYDNSIDEGGYGGGIFNGGTLIVRNSTFSHNSTFNGGGIYNLGNLTVNNSTFSNHTIDGVGGGIANAGSMTINDSNISHNAAGGGGGLHNEGSNAAVNRTTIYSNTAVVAGAGLYNESGLILSNSTLSENAIDPGFGSGGGIYNNFGDVTITSSTLSGNSSPMVGGAIFNQGDLSLRNNIIANSLSGEDCYNDGNININVKNLVEDGTCDPALSSDPLLGPLQDNGGPTLTHALLPGSKAIDAADNATCPATDQRGLSRPQDGDEDSSAICDIGAFEVTPAAANSSEVYLPLILK